VKGRDRMKKEPITALDHAYPEFDKEPAAL
jgi:hypothetical protein